MKKLSEIKIKYDAAPFPPLGIKMDTLYSVKADGESFLISNGTEEIKIDKFMLTNLFVIDGKTKWNEIVETK